MRIGHAGRLTLRISYSRPAQEFARFVSRSGPGCQPGGISNESGLTGLDRGGDHAPREELTMLVGPAEPAVVALPDEIELANGIEVVSEIELAGELDGAGPAYAALRAAVASGARMVIADLTGTTFCDYPGFRQLVMIGLQAATGDVQLRVAMPADGSVRSWLEFLAHHRLVRAYLGLEAAKTA
jgi:hypothetical protein